MATTKKRKPLSEAEKVERVIEQKARRGMPLTYDQCAALRRSVQPEVRR